MQAFASDDRAAATLNKSQGSLFEATFQTYPTIRICRDLIRQYVFERPLIGPSGIQQDLYRRLGRDIMDQALVFGIAIVHAKPGAPPCVVPWELCQVTVSLDSSYNKVMTVFPAAMRDGDGSVPLPHVFVLDVFGFSPSLDGSLNSLMRPLRYKIELIYDQIDCAVAADRARARPPCFTETHDAGTAPAQEVVYDYYADATSVQQTSMNVYMRNQRAMEQIQAQQQQFRAGGDRGEGSNREQIASHNVSMSVKNAIDSITPMPIGQRLARGPECHAPDQLVDRMRFIEQEIFVILGVPRSFCMHDITVRHDAGMLHCTMTRTVHMWQDTIAQALTYVWNVTNNGPPKKKKRMDVQRIAQERNQTIRFERMPRVSVQELSFAYDKGLVTWEAYQRQMSTFCGMDASDLTVTGEPWSKEERMAALGNSSGQSTEGSTEPQGRET